MDKTPVVLFAENEAERRHLAALIESDLQLELRSETGHPDELVAWLERDAEAVALVAVEGSGDAVLDAIEKLPPAVRRFVVLGPEENGKLILRAMRLGAGDFVARSGEVAAVRPALLRLAPGDTHAEAGRLIAVLGAKGGVGATLTACQLALALRSGGDEVALVDLDLRQGDVAVQLDVQPRYGILEASSAEAQPDAAYLARVLHPHGSGVRVMAAPPRLEDVELIDPARVLPLIPLLRDAHDWVVVDLPSDFGELSLGVLDEADLILLVTTLEIPALHHARRALGLLERLGHDDARVRLVANRFERGGAVAERDVLQFLGRPTNAHLANDFAAARECVNFGRSLAEASPRSALARGVAELRVQTHAWLGLEPPARDERRDLVSRLREKLSGAD